MTNFCQKVLKSQVLLRGLFTVFTEIEKNNWFSIYTRSDVNKIRQETIKKYDLTDGSNHAKV